MLIVTKEAVISSAVQGMFYGMSCFNNCRRRTAHSQEYVRCRLVAAHVFSDIPDLDSQWKGQTTLQLYDAGSDHGLIATIHDGEFRLLLSVCLTEDLQRDYQEWVLVNIRLMWAIVDKGPHSAGEGPGILSDPSGPTWIAKGTLYSCQTVILDAVVVCASTVYEGSVERADKCRSTVPMLSGRICI